MKKSLRFVLAAAVLASFAPIAMAAPTNPMPPDMPKVAVAAPTNPMPPDMPKVAVAAPTNPMPPDMPKLHLV
jgi:hypothetical protein